MKAIQSNDRASVEAAQRAHEDYHDLPAPSSDPRTKRNLCPSCGGSNLLNRPWRCLDCGWDRSHGLLGKPGVAHLHDIMQDSKGAHVYPIDDDFAAAIQDAKAKPGTRPDLEALPDPTDPKGPPDWAPTQ